MLFPPVYKALTTDAAVRAIVGARVYRDEADPVPAPFIVWTALAAVPENSLDPGAPTDRHTIRLDVYATTEAGVDALAAAVRNCVQAFGSVQTMQSLGREPDTRYWRITLDVDWFHAR